METFLQDVRYGARTLAPALQASKTDLNTALKDRFLVSGF